MKLPAWMDRAIRASRQAAWLNWHKASQVAHENDYGEYADALRPPTDASAKQINRQTGELQKFMAGRDRFSA